MSNAILNSVLREKFVKEGKSEKAKSPETSSAAVADLKKPAAKATEKGGECMYHTEIDNLDEKARKDFGEMLTYALSNNLKIDVKELLVNDVLSDDLSNLLVYIAHNEKVLKLYSYVANHVRSSASERIHLAEIWSRVDPENPERRIQVDPEKIKKLISDGEDPADYGSAKVLAWVGEDGLMQKLATADEAEDFY